LQRLAVYKDSKNTETQKFISLYGEQHLQNIIKWFEIIVNE
jgi:thiaminase